LTPEKFAEMMCDDLSISNAVFGSQIAESIRSQIEEYSTAFLSEVPPEEDMRIVINVCESHHLYIDLFILNFGIYFFWFSSTFNLERTTSEINSNGTLHRL
jgi:hypothetical protein